MKEAFSIPGNRIKTFILLATCVFLAVVAVVIGIDDNPPGILAAFLAAIAFVLAFIHPWRAARQYRLIFFVSITGAVLFILLNNLFAFFAHNPSTANALQIPLQGLAVACFLMASLICPAGIIIGAVGWIVMVIKSRRKVQ